MLFGITAEQWSSGRASNHSLTFIPTYLERPHLCDVVVDTDES